MRHWVFDLDGTLVDSFGLYFEALDEVFARHGKRFDRALHMPALTETLPQFFERELGPDAVPAAMRVLQERSNADALRIRPFPGVPELLSRLKARGSRIAIWTNRDLVSASLILEHSGLKPYPELFFTADCVPRKPAPEGLNRIAREFGCRHADIIMVGDHEHDVTTPKAAGAKALRASWHGYWQVEPCTLSDRQFFSIEEFSDWLTSRQL